MLMVRLNKPSFDPSRDDRDSKDPIGWVDDKRKFNNTLWDFPVGRSVVFRSMTFDFRRSRLLFGVVTGHSRNCPWPLETRTRVRLLVTNEEIEVSSETAASDNISVITAREG